MSKARYYRFTVNGFGVFPVDMLRYDACWPTTTEHALSIAVDRGHPDYRKLRIAELMSATPPTVDRWTSFGWAVNGIEKVY